MQNTASSKDIIKLLRLEPHPEGGYFRETFRDTFTVEHGDDSQPRAASTAIYFLLESGQISRWHKVDAAETWHWYAGAPLRLSMSSSDQGPINEIVLGTAFQRGQLPQAIVARGHWQQAESLGQWTLVGCTVAPGFRFEGFKLAQPGFHPAS